MYNTLQNACNFCNFPKFVLSEIYSLLKIFFPTVKVTPLNCLVLWLLCLQNLVCCNNTDVTKLKGRKDQ